MDSDDFLALCLDYCKASQVLTGDGRWTLATLTEVFKRFFRSRALALVREAGEQPLLYSYQSDATSYLCHARSQSELDKHMVVRKGKVLHEFLMERAYVKSLTPAGVEQMALILVEPRPLSKGKGAWPCFTAATQFFPSLRKLEHQGICISHFAADRAVFGAMLRKFKQLREVYYSEAFGVGASEQGRFRYLLDWVVGTPCCCHDLQNALKWSLESVGDSGLVDDLHIIMESLRNSFGIIVARLGIFLARNLDFDDTPYDLEAVCQLWMLFGIPADMVDEVAIANPRWRGGKLLVNGAMRGDKCIERVSSICMLVFKWRRFCDTRWATLGPSAMSLASSLYIGLDFLVKAVRDDKSCTDYHLHGFSRLSSKHRRYAVIAGIVSKGPEALLEELMVDDRCVRRFETLTQTLEDEMVWMASISNYAWTELATMVGSNCCATQLRTTCLNSAHVAASFAKNKLFNNIHCYPWKLAIGSISENLQGFRSSDEDLDIHSTEWAIRQLLRMGFSLARLVQAVELLRDIPWSTLPCERSHGSSAVMHRAHPTYSGIVLAEKAFLHMCRCFMTPTLEDNQAMRQQRRIDKLMKKDPARISGKNVFLQDLFHECRAELPPGSTLSRAQSNQIFQAHGALYKALAPHIQDVYDQRAKQLRQAQQHRLRDDIAHETAAAALRVARAHMEEMVGGASARASCHKFSKPDLEELLHAFESSNFNRDELAVLREQAWSAPSAPSPDQISVFESFSVAPTYSSRPQPVDWVKALCYNRKHLDGVIIMGTCAEYAPAALFTYATQSPLEAWFLKMTYLQLPIPAFPQTARETMESCSLWHKHVFEFEFGDYVNDIALPFGDADELFVIEGAVVDGSARCVANSFPVPLAGWILELPEEAPVRNSSESSQPRLSVPEKDALIGKHPWMREYVCGGDLHASHKPSDSIFGDGDGEHPGALPDDALESAFSRLRGGGAELDHECLEDRDDFFIRFKAAAAWVAGEGYEAVGTEARGGAPRKWCVQYKLPQTATFSVARLGDVASVTIAIEWRSRFQHFFNIWRTQPNEAYRYSADDIASYGESAEWCAFVASLEPGSPVALRADAVRHLFPHYV